MSDDTVDFARSRQEMVERQVARRGVRDPDVLDALRQVPREAFVSPGMEEFAYDDHPLPIGEGQTISQPYMVARMTAAAEPSGAARVLEVGTGSGYASAVLARLAEQVFTIERHPPLAAEAARRLRDLGYHNVEVRCGDGSLGWPEAAPFDAILVAAGGPSVPRALLAQLAIGGRLVIPVGRTQRLQELVRVTRHAENHYDREVLGGVRFVPLIGEEGWGEGRRDVRRAPTPVLRGPSGPAHTIAEAAEPFDAIDDVDLAPLLDRIGDARLVLLGEATHGTSEFYRMRTRITQELILRKGFSEVAVEADWPDAAHVDRYVRGVPPRDGRRLPFQRFPTWMWRNREVLELVEWLRAYNQQADGDRPVAFRGLDLYSLHGSIAEVLEYLDRVDPETAGVARARYGCLTPWETDPAAYGRAALTGRYRSCEDEVVRALRELLERRLELAERDGERYFDAAQNARLVQSAEAYYRTMYYGSVASWNLRDQHMFDTLTALLDRAGPTGRIVVWEHNSHVGNARATEMGTRGEHNVGSLARERFGDQVYAIGFGTDRGTVLAASEWGGPAERMTVRPAQPDSYEHTCLSSRLPRFFLPLRHPAHPGLREALLTPRLERAIGVLYRPETELQSHYFEAVLPEQFDEYVWIETTEAVTPLGLEQPASGLPDTYPFGL